MKIAFYLHYLLYPAYLLISSPSGHYVVYFQGSLRLIRRLSSGSVELPILATVE